MMPFDEGSADQRRADDARYLRLTLINIRDELLKRMDAADMAARLLAT